MEPGTVAYAIVNLTLVPLLFVGAVVAVGYLARDTIKEMFVEEEAAQAVPNNVAPFPTPSPTHSMGAQEMSKAA